MAVADSSMLDVSSPPADVVVTTVVVSNMDVSVAGLIVGKGSPPSSGPSGRTSTGASGSSGSVCKARWMVSFTPVVAVETFANAMAGQSKTMIHKQSIGAFIVIRRPLGCCGLFSCSCERNNEAITIVNSERPLLLFLAASTAVASAVAKAGTVLVAAIVNSNKIVGPFSFFRGVADGGFSLSFLYSFPTRGSAGQSGDFSTLSSRLENFLGHSGNNYTLFG